MSNIELLFIHLVNFFLPLIKLSISNWLYPETYMQVKYQEILMHAFNHVVDGALQSIIPMEMLRLLSGICKFCACFIHQITWLHYIDIIYRLMIPKIIGFVISQYDSNLYLLKFGKVVITIQRHNPSKFSILHMLLLPNILVLDISYKIGINSDM